MTYKLIITTIDNGPKHDPRDIYRVKEPKNVVTTVLEVEIDEKKFQSVKKFITEIPK